MTRRDNGFYRHSISGSNTSKFVPCVGRGETSSAAYPSVRVLGLCRVEGCLVALVEMEDKNDRSSIMRRAVTAEELKKSFPHAYIEFLENRVRFIDPSTKPHN